MIIKNNEIKKKSKNFGIFNLNLVTSKNNRQPAYNSQNRAIGE